MLIKLNSVVAVLLGSGFYSELSHDIPRPRLVVAASTSSSLTPIPVQYLQQRELVQMTVVSYSYVAQEMGNAGTR